MRSLFASLNASMSRRFRRFFANRAPRQDTATLSLRNVYIFFSREGLLFALLLLITFIAGINYANNLVLGLCFYLASLWLISLHLTFAHVSGLKVQLMEVSMAATGDPVWATIQIEQSSRQPSRQLLLQFEQPSASADANATDLDNQHLSLQQNNSNLNHASHSPSLDSPALHIDTSKMDTSLRLAELKGTQTIQLPIITNKRGRLELPRLQISTVYPLGIMRAWSYVYFAMPAWVYPKPIAFEWEEKQVIASDDDSEASMHSVQSQNDFDMLDTYVEGESLSRVSWAHVARGQGMLTKHFADLVGREQRLDYADMPAAHHEQKLAQLSHAVQQMGKSGLPFQLVLPNDSSAGDAGRIGQGDAFIKASLLRLAKTP